MCITSESVSGSLAGVSAAVGAAPLQTGTFLVPVTALHAGRREPTGLFWRRTPALFHRQSRAQELTAAHALPLHSGKRMLRTQGHRTGD